MLLLAAKNQADAVDVAQNAYNGLTVTGQTSGSITTPAGAVLAVAGNSYGTLKNLVDKGVFNIQLAPNSTTVSADGTICTTPTDSGKNYRTEASLLSLVLTL